MALATERAPVALALDRIRTDGGTQMRVDLNEDVVEEYAQTIRAGIDLPPVIVFLDGSKHWLADGFHRFFGYKAAGAQTIMAEVRQGTKRDAILYSVGANTSHGLRRTNEDKRKAVLTLLKDKEWSKWSDREIARQAGVSQPFVSGLRPKTDAASDNGYQMDRTRKVERSGTTYQQDTSNIGGSKAIRDAADRAEAEAEAKRKREAEQAENERIRDEARATIAPLIAEREAAKGERPQTKGEKAFAAAEKIGAKKDERLDRQVAELSAAWEAAGEIARQAFLMLVEPAPGDEGLSPQDRIAELEEANRVLEAESARLKEENKLFGEMKAEWANGNFAEVIAGKEEQIRVLRKQVETESADKASWARSSKLWQKRAKESGWSNDEYIDIGRGANG